MSYETVYVRAVKTFGSETQIKKAVEEMGELIVALMHYLDGKASLVDVASEVADVEIMCRQLRIILGQKPCMTEKYKKIKRLEALILNDVKEKTSRCLWCRLETKEKGVPDGWLYVDESVSLPSSLPISSKANNTLCGDCLNHDPGKLYATAGGLRLVAQFADSFSAAQNDVEYAQRLEWLAKQISKHRKG